MRRLLNRRVVGRRSLRVNEAVEHRNPGAACEGPWNGMTEEATTIRCSFCGKSQDEVRTIIAGPRVHICDECVDLCNDIIFARAPSIAIHSGWLGVRCGRVSHGDFVQANMSREARPMTSTPGSDSHDHFSWRAAKRVWIGVATPTANPRLQRPAAACDAHRRHSFRSRLQCGGLRTAESLDGNPIEALRIHVGPTQHWSLPGRRRRPTDVRCDGLL